jgi:TRAP-type C4-dicarboxylate transport system permease small subunit
MLVIRRIADRLINLSAIFGSIGLLVEVAVVLVDVIGRAVGHPLLGSQDLITMTLVIVVFGAMALCDRMGGHIVIDVFEKRFSDLFNRLVDIVAAFLGAAIFLVLFWTVYESSRLSVTLNLSTNLLNLPKAWFQWALCAFSILTAFGMALRGIELVAGIRDVRHEESI